MIAGNKLEGQPSALCPERRDAGTASTRRILLFVIGATAFFIFYEFLKTTLLPGLTMWDSHLISIGVVAVLSAIFISWFNCVNNRQNRELEAFNELLLHEMDDHRQAEQALLQSEATQRLITDNMLDMIRLTDAAGVIQYISPSNTSILGYEPEAMLGKSVFDFLHPEDRDRVIKLFQEHISAALPGRTEYRYRHQSGHYLWEDTVGSVLVDEAGNVTGAVFGARDITQRKEAEQTLRFSEERFAQAFNACPAPMAISTFPEGRYIDINEAYMQVLGYRVEDAIGFTRSELRMWARSEDLVEATRLLEEQGSFHSLETHLRTKSGAIRIGLVSADIIEIGGEKYALTVFDDITERKKAEEALHRYREHLEELVAARTSELHQMNERLQLASVIFENTTSGLMGLDADGIIQSVNPAFTAISGYDREEVIGKDIDIFKYVVEQLGTSLSHEKIASFFRETDQRRNEVWATRKNGGRFLLGYNITAIRNDKGEITDYIFVCQDITEEARIREEKRQIEDQISHMHRLASLNALSAGVVHEIAQPLNAISVLAEGMLYMLKRGKGLNPDQSAEKLHDILEEIERINGLIQHIRSFAHAGYAEPLAPCNINRAIEKALDILGSQLSACGISVQRVLADSLARAEGIDNGLEEVVINLLVNAMEAFNEASCSKKEIIVATCQNGKSVVLEVSDNATGIKDEDRDMIFEPLFSTKRPGKSMGLGLSIVQSLVDKFGGNIDVSNNERGGATFRVELPALKGTGA